MSCLCLPDFWPRASQPGLLERFTTPSPHSLPPLAFAGGGHTGKWPASRIFSRSRPNPFIDLQGKDVPYAGLFATWLLASSDATPVATAQARLAHAFMAIRDHRPADADRFLYALLNQADTHDPDGRRCRVWGLTLQAELERQSGRLAQADHCVVWALQAAGSDTVLATSARLASARGYLSALLQAHITSFNAPRDELNLAGASLRQIEGDDPYLPYLRRQVSAHMIVVLCATGMPLEARELLDNFNIISATGVIYPALPDRKLAELVELCLAHGDICATIAFESDELARELLLVV